jgi:hypothetical protein
MTFQPAQAKEGKLTPQQDGEWIAPRLYFEMALSNRRVYRCDRPAEGICGLLDAETGRRYLIRQEALLDAHADRVRPPQGTPA